MTSRLNQAKALLGSNRMPWAVALIALLLALPSLTLGFMADDYMQRAVFLQPEGLEGMFGDPFEDFFTFADGDSERMQTFVDRGVYPWMVVHEIRMSFWRPVTVATHWVDYALWPDSAFMMHLQSLAWFFLMVALAGYFYRSIMGPTLAAGLAGLLFAVDDAHAWPAAWIANRNALVAMVLCLMAILLHRRWREHGVIWSGLAAIVVYAVALLAKESSLAALGYIGAYAAFLDQGRIFRRVASLIPYVVVTLIWRAVYVHLNYGADASGGYIDPLGSPLQFVRAALVRIPIMLQGQWTFAPLDVFLFAPPIVGTIMLASAWVVAIILAILLFPLLKRDAVARFWCLGMLLALVPIAAASPQDRLLLFPGLGAMGLLAQLLVLLGSGEYRNMKPLVPKWSLNLFRYAFVFIHLVIAPLFLPATIVLLGFLMGNIDRIVTESLPSDESIVDKTFILANGASYPVGTYTIIIRSLEGQPMPAHIRSFAPVSMAAIPMDITRTGENTVVVHPDGGYPWSLFRASDHPLELNEVVELTGLTVKVTKLAEEGWPEEVTYRFEKSLDDPSYLWFRINGFDYESMQVPAIGETLRLEPF